MTPLTNLVMLQLKMTIEASYSYWFSKQSFRSRLLLRTCRVIWHHCMTYLTMQTGPIRLAPDKLKIVHVVVVTLFLFLRFVLSTAFNFSFYVSSADNFSFYIFVLVTADNTGVKNKPHDNRCRV